MLVSVQLDDDAALLARHMAAEQVTAAADNGVPIASAGAFAAVLSIALRLGLHEMASQQLASRCGLVRIAGLTIDELLAEFRALRAADKQVPALCKCARCEQRRAAGEVTP